MLIHLLLVDAKSKIQALPPLIKNKAKSQFGKIRYPQFEVHPLRVYQLKFYFLELAPLPFDLAVINHVNSCLFEQQQQTPIILLKANPGYRDRINE